MNCRTLLTLALLAVLDAHGAASPTPLPPPLRLLTAADSVLVVSPHPDDESLCCGGLIDSARRAGARVAIVWITNGDAFKWDAMLVEKKLRPRQGAYHELAQRRIGEARAAAAILQVPKDSQFFLGYPDRGILSLLFDYYYPGVPWRSRFTGDEAVEYSDAFDPGAGYNGQDLLRDLSSVVDRVQPTLVLAPSPQDTHPDHRAAGILAWRVMDKRQQLDRVRFWIVHGGRRWPRPRGLHPELPPKVPPRGVGMEWEAFALDDAAVQAKLQAIRAHRTQTKIMGKTMLGYVRSQELYSRTLAPSKSNPCLKPQRCEFDNPPIIEGSSL